MPDYIDTREPGWRRTTPGEDRWPNAVARIEYFEDGREIGWVREDPVPPLPTEPYTVIRVEWANGNGRCTMICNGSVWEALLVPEERWSAEKLPALISDFQVLAEPRRGAVNRAEESARRLTAREVLARVLEFEITDGQGRVRAEIRDQVARLARDYGVVL